MPVQTLAFGAAVQVAPLPFDVREQASASLQPLRAAVGQGQGRRLENRRRIVLERSTIKAEAVRASAVAQRTAGCHVQMPCFPARSQPTRILTGPNSSRLVDARFGQND